MITVYDVRKDDKEYMRLTEMLSTHVMPPFRTTCITLIPMSEAWVLENLDLGTCGVYKIESGYMLCSRGA